MKKLLFAFAFVLASMTAAQAQSGFGIRGGVNLSNVSGDLRDEDRFENKFGFHAGITYQLAIVEDFFSIQPELLYSQKGFKNNEDEFQSDLLNINVRREGTVNYSYLDLPVLAKIKAGPLYFEAGPQASYLLSVNNKTKTYNDGELQDSDNDPESLDGLKRFELGYAAGIGLASNNGISIGLRYNGSFADFVDEGVNYGDFDEDLTGARNSVIMLTVGFTFPSGGY